MKNLYILPTNKPSRLVKIYNDVNRETFTLKLDVKVNDSFKEYVNIYITSDEEIKDGEWCLLNNRLVVRYFKPPVESKSFKKIILTTDKDLIKDGVQEIDDEFLEWFVENPNCGGVEVEKYFHEVGDTYDYEIIIPKEEPKQDNIQQFQEGIKSLDNNFKEQENTLEEIVIKNFNEEYIKIDLYDSNDNFIGKLDRNQYIDVRIQAYMKNIKGLYVVYPDGEKGFINHENGAVSYFQEGLWNTALRLSRLLMSLQSNDIKNQNRIIE